MPSAVDLRSRFVRILLSTRRAKYKQRLIISYKFGTSFGGQNQFTINLGNNN